MSVKIILLALFSFALVIAKAMCYNSTKKTRR